MSMFSTLIWLNSVTSAFRIKCKQIVYVQRVFRCAPFWKMAAVAVVVMGTRSCDRRMQMSLVEWGSARCTISKAADAAG